MSGGTGASWVRRDFGEAGLTQYKPGPHLDAVSAHFGGRALLCIDVSSSMGGAPLAQAVAGGLDFLDEADRAGYRIGLILWNSGIVLHLPTDTPIDQVRRGLRQAGSSGGTDLLPTVRAATRELGPLSGDRVVCVFGDGDVGRADEVDKAAAEARRLGIRFVVRGLGGGAHAGLARALSPDDDAGPVESVGDLRRGIASMASALRITR